MSCSKRRCAAARPVQLVHLTMPSTPTQSSVPRCLVLQLSFVLASFLVLAFAFGFASLCIPAWSRKMAQPASWALLRITAICVHLGFAWTFGLRFRSWSWCCSRSFLTFVTLFLSLLLLLSFPLPLLKASTCMALGSCLGVLATVP